MKKMLFGLIATVMMSVSGNAQVKLTQENIREEMSKGMASFTNSLKPAVEKSTDFRSFKFLLLGKSASKVSIEGNKLLEKAYNYNIKGVSEEEILNKDSGVEIAQATLYIINNSSKGVFDPKVVFGGSTGDFNPQETMRCRWYQIGCHLSEIFGPEVGGAILSAIGDAIIILIKSL